MIGLPLAVAALLRDDEAATVQWFVLGLAAAVLAIWQFVAIRRALRQNPNLGQEISGVFHEEGFEIRTPASESRIGWAALASSQVPALLALEPQPLYRADLGGGGEVEEYQGALQAGE